MRLCRQEQGAGAWKSMFGNNFYCKQLEMQHCEECHFLSNFLMVLSSSGYDASCTEKIWLSEESDISSSSTWQHKQTIKNGIRLPVENEKPLNSSHLLWIYCLLLLKLQTNICSVSGSKSIASLSAISHSSGSDRASLKPPRRLLHWMTSTDRKSTPGGVERKTKGVWGGRMF